MENTRKVTWDDKIVSLFDLLADSNVAGRILLFKLLQKFKQISIFDIFDCEPFCCPTQLSHDCKTFK